jgi:phenylacetate-CoA ligase
VLARSVRDQLIRLSSEFAHYVPAERQLPEIVLRPAGDPDYFPVGVKRRYTSWPTCNGWPTRSGYCAPAG